MHLSQPAHTSQNSAEQAQPASLAELALFDLPDVWMGAMVPKRWARRSVTRNAIKRQIYNVSARFGDRLPVAAHVVRLRTTFDRQRFISASSEGLKLAVREELEQLFARALARDASPEVSA